MRNLKEEIDEARAKVAHYRIRAERPGSRLEDDFALEKARNRLLTLELRQLKHAEVTGQERQRATPTSRRGNSGRSCLRKSIGTKSEQIRVTPRERAEKVFAALRQKQPDTGERE